MTLTLPPQVIYWLGVAIIMLFLLDLYALRRALKGIEELKQRHADVFRIAQTTETTWGRRINELEHAILQVTGKLGLEITPLGPTPAGLPSKAPGTPPAVGFEHLHGPAPEEAIGGTTNE